MKKIPIVLAVLIGFSGSALAQFACYSASGCVSSGILYDSSSGVIWNLNSNTCDSNDKTPSEASECKAKFWRSEVDRIQKLVDDGQKKLDHAKERVRAFEKEGR